MSSHRVIPRARRRAARYIELELRPAEPTVLLDEWILCLAYLKSLALAADPAELAGLAERTRRLAEALTLLAEATG